MRLLTGLRILGILSLVSVAVVFQNCGAYRPEEINQTSSKSESEAQNLEELASEIGAKASVVCQSAADCKAVGIGQRLCGGPDEALVYSNKGEDEEELLGLVDAYNDLAKEQARSAASAGNVGICVVAEIPQSFQCVQNVCVGGP